MRLKPIVLVLTLLVIVQCVKHLRKRPGMGQSSLLDINTDAKDQNTLLVKGGSGALGGGTAQNQHTDRLLHGEILSTDTTKAPNHLTSENGEYRLQL